MSAGQQRVFCDTSVLIRYLAEDDVPRALAAARLIDSETRLVVSTGVLLEALFVLRNEYGFKNPELAALLVRFLTRQNVELADADAVATATAIDSTRRMSARHIPDAIIAGAAAQAGCQAIVSFDEKFISPSLPVRLL